jgi:hypothetical protein
MSNGRTHRLRRHGSRWVGRRVRNSSAFHLKHCPPVAICIKNSWSVTQFEKRPINDWALGFVLNSHTFSDARIPCRELHTFSAKPGLVQPGPLKRRPRRCIKSTYFGTQRITVNHSLRQPVTEETGEV